MKKNRITHIVIPRLFTVIIILSVILGCLAFQAHASSTINAVPGVNYTEEELAVIYEIKFIYNLSTDGWNNLKVNYHDDSLETIARKLRDHSPGWKFLGNGGYTYDIPSMKVEGFSEKGFVALPDYSDDVLYDLAVVDNGNIRYIQTTRYIPFDINSDIDVVLYNDWYKDFIPVNIFAFINGTSFADLGLSGQVLQNLRKFCNNSPDGCFTWHEINMEWTVQYVEETSYKALFINMRTLRGQQQFSISEVGGLIDKVEYGLMRE